MSKKKNPSYVTNDVFREVCGRMESAIARNARAIEVVQDALVGIDFKSGLVADIKELQNKLRVQEVAWGLLRPIAIAIITSVTTALILGWRPW